MAENLLDLLECHICFQIFNNDDRKPKVLPCQHTFCLSCLNKMARTITDPDNRRFLRHKEQHRHQNVKKVIVKCSDCSQEYAAPDGSVTNFINDLTMIKFLDALPQTSPQSNDNDDVSELKKRLSDRLNCLRTKLSDVAEIRAKGISTWEKEVNDARYNIEEMFAEIQSVLDKKKATLLAKLKEFGQTRDNHIHKTMSCAFELQMQEIVEFCSLAEELINRKASQVSESTITENMNRCQDLIEQLDEALANNDKDKKWKVTFQAAYQKDAIKVEESTPAAPTAAAEKKEVKKEEVVTPEVEKPQQQAVPEKAPTTSRTTATEEKKTELPKPEKKPEPSQVEVSVVDSVDKKERKKENEDGDTTTPSNNKIQLKYTYRDDTQWSPVNPEGKKQYGRDFLLQFQPECKDKPDGLPHIPDIVLEKADIRPILRVADPSMAFMPDYMRSPRGSGELPKSSRKTRNKAKLASQSAEVALRKAEHPWKPRHKHDARNTLTEEEAKSAELTKAFKSILNKLTPQNFQKLMAKTVELPIDNEERLTAIIDLVFEKAIREPAYSKAYANMCRVLSQIKVPSANGTGNLQFRTILIDRCQKAENDAFIEMRKDIDAMEVAQDRQKENEKLFMLLVKARQKILGNMRFIGELFKLRILKENFMHDCILKRLRAKDDNSLECVVVLMTTVGKDLDHERAKKRIDQYFTQISKIIANRKTPARIRFMLQDVVDLRKKRIDQYFTQISKIIANRKTPARIRFMLQDVVDLRKCHWVPRRDDNAPKTIAQIHLDAKQEEAAKKIEAQMAIHSHSSKSRKGNRSSKGGPPPPQPSSNDDWQTVSVNKSSPQIDPKLEYTLQKTSSMDPLVMMTTELGFMLARKDCNNDNIFDWIEKNVDSEQRKQKDFIRALVTVVCQSTMEGNSGRCDPDLLKIRAKCLLRYIDRDAAKELQALFAVQALNHKLVNPPGFLRLIFDVLYDEDVISQEDSFYAWQNSSDPAEQAGKGVAIKSVTRFFAWLREAEDDGGN